MSTLSLKPNINTQLLESIQAQNEYIITLLEENNKLLKDKPKQSKQQSKNFHDTIAYTTAINMFNEFTPGNNYNTVVKLAKWCSKWDKQYINEINTQLQTIDMSTKNKSLFLKMIDKINA